MNVVANIDRRCLFTNRWVSPAELYLAWRKPAAKQLDKLVLQLVKEPLKNVRIPQDKVQFAHILGLTGTFQQFV